MSWQVLDLRLRTCGWSSVILVANTSNSCLQSTPTPCELVARLHQYYTLQTCSGLFTAGISRPPRASRWLGPICSPPLTNELVPPDPRHWIPVRALARLHSAPCLHVAHCRSSPARHCSVPPQPIAHAPPQFAHRGRARGGGQTALGEVAVCSCASRVSRSRYSTGR
jgi:hypothetical protein